MFQNIGGKLKGLARVLFILCVIAGLVGAIVLWNIKVYSRYSETHPYIGAGIGVLAGGFLVGWLSSAFIYAFGQLVQNSDKLVDQNTQILNRLERPEATERPAAKPVIAGTWKCKSCGAENSKSANICLSCGEKRTEQSRSSSDNSYEVSDYRKHDATWKCSVCGTENQISSQTCSLCHTKRIY